MFIWIGDNGPKSKTSSQRLWITEMANRAALPARHVCITDTPACTHTHTHGEKWAKWQAEILFQKASLPCSSFSFFPTIWVIYIEGIKHTVYVLLSRWLSISGFLYPYTTVHSLLMANYIKYNGSIMLSSENKDLKYEIIHFTFPIILYCRVIKTILKNTH